LAGLPGLEKKPIYKRKWFAELLGSVPPVIGILITAIANLGEQDETRKKLSYVGFGAAIWLVLAGFIKVIQASQQDSEDKPEKKFDGLSAALHVVHAAVAQAMNFRPGDHENGKLRITVHRVVPDG
jgi:hypothetical protein